ncbi:MAG: Proline-rich protein, partial [Labilithrix sp.]|nr:Proline-rich protein [Labilithrix sp.]
MFRTNTSILLALLLTTAACGGSDQPAAKNPEMEPVAANATADMPAAPATEAPAADAKPATETAPGVPDPSAAPSTLALPASTAKIDMKGKKAAKVELKSDGTVANGGKAVAKVTGMTLQSPDGGKTFLTVGSDGAVTTGDGGSFGSFAGDELTMAKGDKLSLGDDGTLTMTSGGKAAPLGKFDGAGTAKRSAVLAAAFVLAPPAAEKPAADAKPATETAPGVPDP